VTKPFDGAEPISLSAFESRNCIDVVIDVPGDSEVRPIPPSRRAQAIAEREKILRWSKPGLGSLPPENNQ
jgi:hypothetical protein